MSVTSSTRTSKRPPSARPRILQGMTEAVARDGYTRASVARALQFSRASRTTFYDCFADLDECFLAAAEAISDGLRATVEERTADEPPQRFPFVAAETLLDFAETEPASARLLFTELLAGGSRALDIRDALIDRIATVIEDGWLRGVDEVPTIDVPARALVGGIFRTLAFAMRERGGRLHEVRPAILAWIDSYTLIGGAPAWQTASALESLNVPVGTPVEPMPPPPRLPSGRRTRHPAERAKNHRDRLLHATAASVHAKGYAAVSVTDIVRGARVSRAVFYEHFTDKQSAASHAMQHAFDITMNPFGEAFFATPDWPTAIWDGARALTDACRDELALTYLAYVEGHALGPIAASICSVRMLTFTIFLERGYHHRTDGAPLSRITSQILACATLEMIYREQPGRFPPAAAARLPEPRPVPRRTGRDEGSTRPPTRAGGPRAMRPDVVYDGIAGPAGRPGCHEDGSRARVLWREVAEGIPRLADGELRILDADCQGLIERAGGTAGEHV